MLVVVVMPTGRPYTIDDLDDFPDDSNRYELIEGSLHVTPSPGMVHQEVVANVFLLLDRACPSDLKVWLAPLDVVFAATTVLQPDVFVLPADAPRAKRVVTTPLLAVEVLSPSTRAYDLGTKLRVYREAGVGAYWVVDPAAPALTTWIWLGGDEVEREATGDDALEETWPFPVTVVPSTLVT